MALWDASIGWITLVVRAPDAEQARDLAIAEVGSRGFFETTFEKPELTSDWPRRLDPDGPSEILVEDSD